MPMKRGTKMPPRKCRNYKCKFYSESKRQNCHWEEHEASDCSMYKSSYVKKEVLKNAIRSDA